MPTESKKSLKKSLRDYEAAADKRVLKVDELKSAAKLIEVAEDKGLDKEVSALRKQLQTQPGKELIVAGPLRDETPIRLPAPGKKVNDLGMGITEIVPKDAKQPERVPKPRPPVKNEIIPVGQAQDRTAIRMPPSGKREIDIGMGKREIVPENLKRPGGVEGIPKISRSVAEEVPTGKIIDATVKDVKPDGLFSKLGKSAARVAKSPAGKAAAAAAGLVGAGATYMGMKSEAKPEQPKTEITQEEVKAVEKYLENITPTNTPAAGANTAAAETPQAAPAPKTFAQVLAQLRRESTGLSADDKKAFQSRIDELNNRLVAEEKRYEDAKERASWGEIAEIIGQATIQLMAGAQASRYGQSAAGIAAPRINWDSRFDRLIKEYDSRKDTIEKQRAGLEREMERADAKEQRKGERVQDWIVQYYRDDNERAFRTAEATRKGLQDKGIDQTKIQREANAKAKAIISNYELAADAVRRLQQGDYEGTRSGEGRRELESEVAKQLSAAGNVGAVKALQEGVKRGWLKDDYTKLQNYIDLSKKSGIINHYRGYEMEVPEEIRNALNGIVSQPSETFKQPKKIMSADELPEL